MLLRIEGSRIIKAAKPAHSERERETHSLTQTNLLSFERERRR